MSVSPKICIAYEADASKIIVKDQTGEYVENFNETGYGTPNLDRSAFAAVLVVDYIGYKEDNRKRLTNIEEYVDFSVTHNNDYVTRFEVPYENDGYHVFHYVLVPTSISSPEAGDIYYDENAASLLQYDDSLAVVAVFDFDKLLDTSKYALTKVEELPTVKLSSYANNLGQDYFIGDYCNNNQKDYLLMNNVKITTGIGVCKTTFNVSKLEAQRILENLLSENEL